MSNNLSNNGAVTGKIWSNIAILMNQRTDKPVMFVSASLEFKTIQDQLK